MKSPTKACSTMMALALVLMGGMTSCASDNSPARLDGEKAAGEVSSSEASIADLRWSDTLTREDFKKRWKIDYEDAIYDASRTAYTTPQEFREAHGGEDYKSWYSRVAKKDYDTYMKEKTEIVHASPSASVNH